MKEILTDSPALQVHLTHVAQPGVRLAPQPKGKNPADGPLGRDHPDASGKPSIGSATTLRSPDSDRTIENRSKINDGEESLFAVRRFRFG